MASLEEILIVKQGEALYGISTTVVAYILRLQELTPVPLAPPEIAGLCAIEGSILSALDFSILIQSDNQKVNYDSEKSRMVTIKTDEHYFSLLVEEVINAVGVEESDLESVEANNEEQNSAVIALYKHKDEIVQIISIERLIEDIKLPDYVKKSVNDISSAEEESKNLSKSRRYLLFKMGEERFAVNVDETREIITVPDSFTPIADSQNYITGMMSLREELLVVADLRVFYNLECSDCTKNRIIVIQKSGRAMGVIVDEILDIQDVLDSDMSSMPGSFDDEKISGVIQSNGILTSVVSSNVLQTLMESQSHLLKSTHSENAGSSAYEDDDKIEVAIFKLSNEEYAFEIDNVAEIIDMSDITEVADTPVYILGVTNIRGQVIPIVSLRARIGVDNVIEEDSKIIVGILNEKQVGFVVDKVMDVSDINQDSIKEQADSVLFNKILHLDGGKRLVLLMQMNKLLDDEVMMQVQDGVA